MKVQVLVAAMHQNDHSLLEKMNIQSDVIVGNQCDYNSVEEFEYNGFSAKYLNFAERGVGLNRNNALMRASGDICLFADDDMVYVDGYAEIVQKAFSEIPDADVMVFNLAQSENARKRYVIPKKIRVNRLNFLRYGAARIAVKRASVKENGIYFNQCFGGGTEHSSGEDNLFLSACLDKGLKVYAMPYTIAELKDDRESTWFKGFDDKYLADKGKLYKTMSRRWWRLLCLQDAIRQRGRYNKPWRTSYLIMTSAK